MPEDKKPPQEFINWLFAYYGEREAGAYYAYVIKTGEWQNDSIYLYWLKNVASQEGDNEEKLRKAVGADALASILQKLRYTTDMTESEAVELYTKYEPIATSNLKAFLEGLSPEIRNELNQFSSEKDLQDRINRLDVDRATKASIYDYMLSQETTAGMAIKAAEGRSLAEEVEAKAAQEKLKYEGEVSKMQEQNVITQMLDRIQRTQPTPSAAPTGGKDWESTQRLIDIFNKSPYQAGLGEDIKRRLGEVERQSEVQRMRSLGWPVGKGEQAFPMETAERERARALLSAEQLQASRNFMDEQKRAEREGFNRALRSHFPYPSPEPTISRLIGQTGLGKGTRLASFMESELRNEPGLERRRRKWWEGILSLHEPGPKYYTPDYLAGMALLRNPSLNPEELRKESFVGGRNESASATLLDPLYSVFNEPIFRQRYFRRPGVGTVPRLQPAVRFR